MVPYHDLGALFQWALSYDLALFPIKSYSKQPVGIVQSHANDWSKEATRWWEWYQANGGCNFGVSCGPSGVIVVDVDLGGEGKFREWCETGSNTSWIWQAPTVSTPTGGKHFYFKVPAGIDSETLRQPNLCGKEVNVRAGNGYVVSPFSVTDPKIDNHVKAAGPYALSNPGILAPEPRLTRHCEPQATGAPTIQPEEIADHDHEGVTLDPIARHETLRRAAAALDRLENAMPGERNEKLNQAAFDLGKLVAEGKLAEWRAVEMLQTTGERIGIPRDEAKARSTIRSGLKAAPKVGRPEPRSAMMNLLAAAVPVEHVKPRPTPKPPFPTTLVPLEPLVERLLYRGQITVLSGASGSGKTTFLASLIAASVADAKDFMFGDFAANASDVLMYPSCWVFLSYEGGQHIKRTTAGWHAGTGCSEKHPDRVEMLSIDDGCLISMNAKREAIVNEAQALLITDAIARLRDRYPGAPVTLVVDNATTAVENCMDQVQAQRFVQVMRTIARQDVAVVVLAHPPKSGNSDIIGSHIFYSLADIVGTIEVLRRGNGEWVQWLDFSKHREAANGKCLEVRSRRMTGALVALPDTWGGGNARARARQEAELHVPYVYSIRVRDGKERDAVESGVVVVDEVTAKAETSIQL